MSSESKDRQLLKEMVSAWESLPGGRNYSVRVVEKWLLNNIDPVINRIRKHLKETEQMGTSKYRQLTEDDIKAINKMCPEDQGVFREAFCVKTDIKEPCVYMRWNTGGMTGGGYHDDDYCHPYEGESRPEFVALKLTLNTMGVNPMLAHKIETSGILIDTSETDNEDYYGNYDNYDINYIPLSSLYKFVEEL